MIYVLMRGKKVIKMGIKGTFDYIKPGDENYPDFIYTKDGFERKFNQLVKQGYQIANYIAQKPKAQSKKKYFVKIGKVKNIIPPLLKEFIQWLKGQTYGSVGWFELTTKTLPKKITDDKDLLNNAFSFIQLPEGSEISLSQNGEVTYLDSEGGKPRKLAKTLKDFLGLLAKGKTKVSDLDEKNASGRSALQTWLKSKK